MRQLDQGQHLGLRSSPRGVTTVGVLSTRDHPLLPYVLDVLAHLRGTGVVLILDEKGVAPAELSRFEARTDGRFPPRDLGPYLERLRWISVPDHNGRRCRESVVAEGIRLLVNAGTPRRIGPGLLELVPVLNVHPGILPKYRGASSPEWAILNDDPVGVSAHFMDAGLDSGPIIFTRELPVVRGQTYADLRAALYRLTLSVTAEAIEMVVGENLDPSRLAPQPPGKPLAPIPDGLFESVKEKLLRGGYACAD